MIFSRHSRSAENILSCRRQCRNNKMPPICSILRAGRVAASYIVTGLYRALESPLSQLVGFLWTALTQISYMSCNERGSNRPIFCLGVKHVVLSSALGWVVAVRMALRSHLGLTTAALLWSCNCCRQRPTAHSLTARSSLSTVLANLLFSDRLFMPVKP